MQTQAHKMTEVERVHSIRHAISEHEANGLTSFYGEELPTGLLARDNRSFRIFSKQIEETKSGKADLVELAVFISQDDKPFAFVRGVTYIPKFASKDQYWIMTNKISGKLQDDPAYIEIDSTYIPRKYKSGLHKYSHSITQTPEERHAEHLDFLKGFLLQSEVKAYPMVVVAQ